MIKNIKSREIKRGNIYYYDFGETEGSIQSGRRPVLVLQADSVNVNAPTIVVASITSVIKRRYLPTHIVIEAKYGLSMPSMILLEQLSTVNKSELTEYVGYISDEVVWTKINNALRKTFGLWLYDRERSGDIRCLCPKCLKAYFDDTNYMVRRLDPFAKEKDKCDKCNNFGWDYVVYDKRTAMRKKAQ